VILTDKTGTLTENEMTVREVWAGGIRGRFGGVGYEPRGSVELEPENGDESHLDAPAAGGRAAVEELLRAAALCCDAHLLPDQSWGRWRPVGDPTESAILVAAAKARLTPERLADWPRLAELPFDSARRRMTTVQRVDGREVACVKGAPSEIFPRCTSVRRGLDAVRFGEAERTAAQAAHDALARRGMRVLAVAVRDLEGHEGLRVEEVEKSLTLLGLLAMEDPPRPEVPEAVALCRRAGVRVLMVTGDQRHHGGGDWTRDRPLPRSAARPERRRGRSDGRGGAEPRARRRRRALRPGGAGAEATASTTRRRSSAPTSAWPWERPERTWRARPPTWCWRTTTSRASSPPSARGAPSTTTCGDS
jgi:hypothetical protein